MSARQKVQRPVRNGNNVNSNVIDRASSRSASSQPLRRSKTGIRLARLIVLASLAVIAGVLWFSIQYLINPDLAFWIDRGLFGLTNSPDSKMEQPHTLARIQSDLAKAGLFAGQPIVLKRNFALSTGMSTTANFVIPILTKDNSTDCSEPCREIRQLYVYRSLQLPFLIRLFQSNPYYRRTDAIAVQGPSGSDLLALDQNPLVSVGSDQPLPITQSEIYDLAPEPGVWLRLIGIRTLGNSVSTYGQVFYFNPLRERLDLMVNWVSPPGEVPQWREVTGDNLPELMVNQTVGLEPQYAVYQLKLADGAPYQLRPILLTEPAFASEAYTNALAMARSGLWTPSQKLLTQVKQANPKQWTATAQAQLDLIQLHANVTQAQANQPSASNVQRIMGYLINGSWQPALEVLQSDRSVRSELREMLLSDSGHLGNRIDTALKFNAGDSNIIAWGAMLRSIRSSEAQAIAWVQRQAPGNAATLAQSQKLIRQLNQVELPPAVPAIPSAKSRLVPAKGANSNASDPASAATAAPTSVPEPNPQPSTSDENL